MLGSLVTLFRRTNARAVVAATMLQYAFVCGCVQNPISYSNDAKSAAEAIHQFYALLDVNTYREGALEEVVTDNFLIYEVGKAMNLSQFHDYISHVDPTVDPLSLTQWSQSNIVVSSDQNSVHVNYSNTGRFEHGQSLTVIINWLESGYFVRTADGLKLQFLNVNLVSKSFE